MSRLLTENNNTGTEILPKDRYLNSSNCKESNVLGPLSLFMNNGYFGFIWFINTYGEQAIKRLASTRSNLLCEEDFIIISYLCIKFITKIISHRCTAATLFLFVFTCWKKQSTILHHCYENKKIIIQW